MPDVFAREFLVKPAGPDCNLACDYCFYRGKYHLFPDSERRMNDAVLELMIKQIMAPGSELVSISWQGGEPTLMGLPFFYRAVEYMEKYGRGITVGNGFQTNGLLLDKKWIKFFKKFNFLVGISLDGPEHVHDHYRRTAGGLGTWSRVSKQAKLMLDSGVDVNVLSVVHDYAADFPDEIYGFHKELGLGYMQFIPCLITDPQITEGSAFYSVSAEKYGNFLCRIFDLWMSDFVEGRPTTSIRFFESLLYSYKGLAPPDCTLSPECGSYLVIEHDGDVFVCDFFVEKRWRLGNLGETNLNAFFNSEKLREFKRLKQNLPNECLVCRWLKHCYGGCTRYRIRDPHEKSCNRFCNAFKTFFSHADEHLQRMARNQS